MTQPTQSKVPAKAPLPSTWAGWVRWKHFPVACLVVWCLVGVIVRSGPSMTVLTSGSSYADFMTPVSGVYALASGMHANTDFSTALGVAYYLPYSWMMRIFGNTAAVVRETASLMFVVFSVVTFLLLRPPRYSWRITALSVVLLSLLASSPAMLGDPPSVIYEGIAYNYICIAAGYLCLLTALFPLQGSGAAVQRRELVDGLLLAAGLVWVTFMKLNFLVQNVVFLAAAFGVCWLTQSKRPVRLYAIMAGAFVVFSLLFIMVFSVNVGGMLDDVKRAATCRAHWVLGMISETDTKNAGNYMGLTSLYLRGQKAVLLHQAELLLVTGALLAGVGAVVVLGRTSLRRVAVYGGLLVLVLFFDLSQDFFNTYGDALPMIPFMWLFLLCVLERGECIQDSAPLAETARATRGYVGGVAATAVGCYIAFFGAGHASAFFYNTGMSEWVARDNPSVVIHWNESIQAKGWEHLYYASARGEKEPPISFVAKINAGLAILRDNHLDQSRIFAIDQINPFPFLLNAPYPEGQPAWLHVEATFNMQTHLPAETIFHGADVVMIPKNPLNPWCLQVMFYLYKPYLEANYSAVGENESWQLLRRNAGR